MNESADIHYHPLLRSIVLATIFCISWYKVVKQRSLVVYHEVSHLSLVFTWCNICLKIRVYTEKLQVACEKFHGIPGESVAHLVRTTNLNAAVAMMLLMPTLTLSLYP